MCTFDTYTYIVFITDRTSSRDFQLLKLYIYIYYIIASLYTPLIFQKQSEDEFLFPGVSLSRDGDKQIFPDFLHPPVRFDLHWPHPPCFRFSFSQHQLHSTASPPSLPTGWSSYPTQFVLTAGRHYPLVLSLSCNLNKQRNIRAGHSCQLWINRNIFMWIYIDRHLVNIAFLFPKKKYIYTFPHMRNRNCKRNENKIFFIKKTRFLRVASNAQFEHAQSWHLTKKSIPLSSYILINKRA